MPSFFSSVTDTTRTRFYCLLLGDPLLAVSVETLNPVSQQLSYLQSNTFYFGSGGESKRGEGGEGSYMRSRCGC